jgi:hypothetical protein
MTKNQKMLLGVGAVAVIGYFLWKKQSTTTSWTGASNFPPAPRLKYATGTSKLAMKPCDCVTSCSGSGGANTTAGASSGSAGSSQYPSGVCLAPDITNSTTGQIYSYIMKDCSSCKTIKGSPSFLAKK